MRACTWMERAGARLYCVGTGQSACIFPHLSRQKRGAGQMLHSLDLRFLWLLLHRKTQAGACRECALLGEARGACVTWPDRKVEPGRCSTRLTSDSSGFISTGLPSKYSEAAVIGCSYRKSTRSGPFFLRRRKRGEWEARQARRAGAWRSGGSQNEWADGTGAPEGCVGRSAAGSTVHGAMR